MKRAMLMMGSMSLLLPLVVTGQVRNEDMSNAILAARKKQATLLQQYAWSSRIELVKGGDVQDIRIYSVSCGPDGKPQRSLINDQPGQLPGGFVRKAVAEKKRKELDEYVAGLGKLLDQYTLSSAGAIINYLAQAQVTPLTTPDNRTVLQVTGSGVVVPGDSFSMTLDGTTLQPTSVQVTTFYNGTAATVSATFRTMPGGLNHLQYGTVVVPSKNLTLMAHNYDYVGSQ